MRHWCPFGEESRRTPRLERVTTGVKLPCGRASRNSSCARASRHCRAPALHDFHRGFLHAALLRRGTSHSGHRARSSWRRHRIAGSKKENADTRAHRGGLARLSGFGVARRASLSVHWARGKSHGRDRRSEGRSERLLRRRRQRRSVEDDRCRRALGSDLRRSARVLHRRDRRRAVRPERRLGGHGRVVHPQPHLDRLGHVPLDRRRERRGRTSGSRTRDASRASPIDPTESRSRARRGARTRVRAAAGARHLPHGRWRQDVGEGAVRERLHRRQSTCCSIRPIRASLYAAMWQIEIHTWGRESGGAGSGIWKSTDGGTTWTRLTGHGLPTRPFGKVGLGISAAMPERIYAADRDRRRRAARGAAHRTRGGSCARTMRARRWKLDEQRPAADGPHGVLRSHGRRAGQRRTRRTSSRRTSPRRSTAGRR